MSEDLTKTSVMRIVNDAELRLINTKLGDLKEDVAKVETAVLSLADIMRSENGRAIRLEAEIKHLSVALERAFVLINQHESALKDMAKEMPGLIEIRKRVMLGVWGLVGIVGTAIVVLVLK